MEIISALVALFEENPLVTGGFPLQRRAGNPGIDVFLDVSLNKLLNKQSSDW